MYNVQSYLAKEMFYLSKYFDDIIQSHIEIQLYIVVSKWTFAAILMFYYFEIRQVLVLLN